MEIGAIRELVGRTTRKVFGVDARLVPMVAGAMDVKPDPSRAVVDGLKGRFEEWGEALKQFGEMKVVSNPLAISFMTIDLPWEPRRYDRAVIATPEGEKEFAVQYSTADHVGRTYVILTRN
jgi:hypothetical protein